MGGRYAPPPRLRAQGRGGLRATGGGRGSHTLRSSSWERRVSRARRKSSRRWRYCCRRSVSSDTSEPVVDGALDPWGEGGWGVGWGWKGVWGGVVRGKGGCCTESLVYLGGGGVGQLRNDDVETLASTRSEKQCPIGSRGGRTPREWRGAAATIGRAGGPGPGPGRTPTGRRGEPRTPAGGGGRFPIKNRGRNHTRSRGLVWESLPLPLMTRARSSTRRVSVESNSKKQCAGGKQFVLPPSLMNSGVEMRVLGVLASLLYVWPSRLVGVPPDNWQPGSQIPPPNLSEDKA